ncbi:MAG: division/cell wall cluster transcriptional repressor MraZ [Bacteroidetes bacterium]|nr:division/cell wall cluster transcriptional repressor MraZ [Bacteroidota bacterium]
MMNFYETYECKIDDKGRLKFPSALMKALKITEEKTFVIKRAVHQNCLEVYPAEPWKKIMSKIGGLNRFVKKNADFIRLFTAGVKSVELDSSDRIQIPKDLKLHAQLCKDIVISGAGDIFEIWDKAAFENFISTSESSFSSLAEEVMGDIDFETE